MTTLNNFNKVDNTTQVLAKHINDLIAASLLSEYKNIEVLSATRTLLDADTPIQRFDCNGGNRISKMPTANAVTNHPYLISNDTGIGSYTLTIQNNGGTITYAVLAVNMSVLMIPDGEGAYVVVWTGPMTFGEFSEQASAPAAPSANYWRLYFKSGGLYIKNSAGLETGPLGGGGGDKYPMEFRLTPQTANPMPGTGITSTTLYAAQFQGNQIALYTGGAWVTRTSAEFSLALGTMTTDLPYDIFCYDNSGTPTLEKLAWTNGTTRATALALQDGVYVKSGDATRRYLGTIRPSTTTQIKTLATRYDVWNYYNQVPTILGILNTTNHTYSTATWRAWNNDLANSSVSFVLGLAQNCIAVYRGRITAATGGGIGFGVNSTTAPGGTKGEQFNNVADVASSDMFSFSPGSNYWCAVEYGTLTTERVSLTLQVMM